MDFFGTKIPDIDKEHSCRDNRIDEEEEEKEEEEEVCDDGGEEPSQQSREDPINIMVFGGGGSKGYATLAICEEIEQVAREELGQEDFVSRFDLLAGTSAGGLAALIGNQTASS